MNSSSSVPTTLDKQGFIQFFEAIPSNKWLVYDFKREDACCALGHLGQRSGQTESEIPEAAKALANLFSPLNGNRYTGGCRVAEINNGEYIPGSTDFSIHINPEAKTRMIEALHALP